MPDLLEPPQNPHHERAVVLLVGILRGRLDACQPTLRQDQSRIPGAGQWVPEPALQKALYRFCR